MSQIIKDFFKEKKVDKIQGVTIKNIFLDSENGSDEWFCFMSREEFNTEHLTEDYKFIFGGEYERLYDTEDEIIEYLYDDFCEYLKTLSGITDEEHDNALDLYQDSKCEDILKEYLEE